MSIGPRRDARAGMSFGRKAGLGLALAGALLLLAPSVAGAEDAELTETADLGQQVNLLWIIIGAVLVVFMQAGFALVETGFCRAKHAAHVVSTNFAIFGLGFVGYFLVGYSFMFGGYSYLLPGFDFGYTQPLGDALIGSGNWVFLWQGGFALSGDAIATSGGAAVIGFFLYMVAFMDTVATIPTGAMAERWKWNAFVGWGLFCGAIYYPIFGAWTWGGGWLAKTWDTWASGPATSTSPARASCTPSAASPLWPVPWCSAPASASSTPTGRPTPCRVTTSRWRCWAASSCCSAGSGSTPPRRWPPPTCSSPSWPPTRPSPVLSVRSRRCS